MGKIRLILGASILLLVSLQANAIIIGDKDWFQVSRTTGFGWETFERHFSTSTGECGRVECIVTDINGRESNLTQYTWASIDDFNELLAVYGVPGFIKDENGQGINTGVNDIFKDFDSTNGTNIVEGMLRDWIVPECCFALHYPVISVNNNEGVSASVSHSYVYLDEFPMVPLPRPIAGQGGWFFRTIPIPSTIWLFGAALIGFVGVSRRRKVA